MKYFFPPAPARVTSAFLNGQTWLELYIFLCTSQRRRLSFLPLDQTSPGRGQIHIGQRLLRICRALCAGCPTPIPRKMPSSNQVSNEPHPLLLLSSIISVIQFSHTHNKGRLESLLQRTIIFSGCDFKEGSNIGSSAPSRRVGNRKWLQLSVSRSLPALQ